jgi:tetratricopeptide (TPR) repeat protein
MLKLQSALASGLATLLVTPALLNPDDMLALETTLERTQHALIVLSGIKESVERGVPGAIELAAAATEPPILDAPARDERLFALRSEVNLLQAELDGIDGKTLAGGAAALAGTVPIAGVPGENEGEPPLFTGLDDAARRALALLPSAEPSAATGARASASGSAPQPRTRTPEHPGYSADPLLQARACFKAERFDDALKLLRSLPEGSEPLWWAGRTLDRLGRLDEAVKTFRKLLERFPDSAEAPRARTELEFLEWKLEFDRKLPAGLSGASPERKRAR